MALTAGLLWTPMHESGQIEQQVDNLIGQIRLATDSHDTDEPLQSSDRMLETSESVQELRDELERLKVDQELGQEDQVATGEGSVAMVPAAVPKMPPGVLVTESMKQILSNLLTEDITRIGMLVISIFILVGACRCFES